MRYFVAGTLFFAILGTTSLLAQPNITSTDGAWLDGNTVTLRGNNFGTKGHAPPVLWDTVDNQAMYTGVGHGDPIPTGSGYPWDSNGSTWAGPVTRYDSGGESWYRAVKQGYFSTRDFGSDRIYINWWFRPSDSLAGDSNKLIRIWATGAGNPPDRFSWTTMHMTAYQWDSGNYVSLVSWPSWSGNTGQWNHLETYLDCRRSSQGEGKIRCWTNGRLLHDHDNMYTTSPLNYIHRFGMDVAYASDHEGHTWDFGWVYLDTTYAHVIIANAASLSPSTHTEVQIPISWSPDTIIVDANQGSFPAGADVWYYVFDREGRVNSVGFPVEGVEVPGQPGQPERVPSP